MSYASILGILQSHPIIAYSTTQDELAVQMRCPDLRGLTGRNRRPSAMLWEAVTSLKMMTSLGDMEVNNFS
ncbi:MAG: hypothetical protein ABIG95_01700 [Candidatus Woesearchaeota archaeon]